MRKSVILRRKLNSLARRRGWTRAPARPIRAWISPTTVCNLKCRTCGRLGELLPKPQHMSAETYAIVRREILPYLGEVTLSGAGEPLMAPLLPQMLEDCAKHQARVSLITNGMIRDEGVFRRLIETGSHLTVSVDGADAETMDYVRRGLKFDFFCETLELLSRLKREIANPRFELLFNVVLLRRNLEQLGAIVEWAARLDVGCILFSNYRASDSDSDFAEQSLERNPELVNPVLDEIGRKCAELGVHCVRPQFLSDEQANTKRSATGRLLQCPVPWWGLMVEADGSLFPCCQWWPPLGNLHDAPFKKIWNGAKFREIRRQVNSLPLPPSCQQCILFERKF